MEVTQALRNAENSLRDFIGFMLLKSKGVDWINECGVSSERIAIWGERKKEEQKKQRSGYVDERLLYYADFYDLETILSKNWEPFYEALGDKKTFMVYFRELEKYRNADAHRREILNHQKYLLIGISGEIRNKIVRYRSRMDTNADDYFPRIESAQDSLGHGWSPSGNSGSFAVVETNAVLRPGDELDFVVIASDPEDRPLEYAVRIPGEAKTIVWDRDFNLSFQITTDHIGRYFHLEVMVRSDRGYHAHVHCDHSVIFSYQVLPAYKT